VIGINTAIVSGSGGYQGVGFALPINTAANVYNQIIKNGKVTRGAIGVNFENDVKPELLAVYGAKEGVFVQKVPPGMPADRAGIHPEDIIIAINGRPIKDGTDLINRISDTPIGAQVKITVLRDRKPMDFMVTIGDRQDVVNRSLGVEHHGEAGPTHAEAGPAKLGVSIENLSDARKEALGFKGKAGVLVAEVVPGSFAGDLGLAEHDIIVSINRQPVTSAEDVTRIWGLLKPGDPIAFHVMRSDSLPGRPGAQSGRAPEWNSFYPAGAMPSK